jgi:hypothetical protein
MSDYGIDDKKNYILKRDKFYGIDNLEHNDITDPKYVLRELSKRHNRIQREIGHRNSLLDEEGRDFHATLPNSADFSSYQVTQSIYEDMSKPREFI